MIAIYVLSALFCLIIINYCLIQISIELSLGKSKLEPNEAIEEIPLKSPKVQGIFPIKKSVLKIYVVAFEAF